ncbi:MAG: coproporphyrinogen dehydrogenase HemZ [Lachnospiraceae bacterium]|nr:coproporphyrinogen dehydrogenase HemZ [Lachnospiraceae bacterium]
MITVKNDTYTAYEQDIRELLNAFFPGEEILPEGPSEAFSVDIDRLMDGTVLTGIRHEDKSVIKKNLYIYLNEKTGKKLPWGTLTGIKPVKLADKYLSTGIPEHDVERMLKDKYLISDEKCSLIMGIALKENSLLKGLPLENGFSVYTGIPFCPTRCLYCSFTSNPIGLWKGRTGEYLNALRKEYESLTGLYHRKTGKNKLDPSTLYIGGGTPTALSADDLKVLMDIISEYVDMDSLHEFTCEAGRPDSITMEKLNVLRNHGVNRISVNPQTMNQKTLDLIGRRHTVEETREAFSLARSAGFTNINMDLIMGLPGETKDDVAYTLSEIEKLRPESLTVHALAVKRAARLSTEHDPWTDYERAEGDEAALMTAMGAKCAKRMGMEPYYLYRQKNIAGNQENVGYCVPGKESLYNIIMMEEKQAVIGMGAGSTTKLSSKERVENIKDLTQYLLRTDEVTDRKEKLLAGFFGNE